MPMTCRSCGHKNRHGAVGTRCPACGQTYTPEALDPRTVQRRATWMTVLMLGGVLMAASAISTRCDHVAERQARQDAAAAADALQARAALVADGRIVVGMSAAEVRAAWGAPTTVTSSVRSNGTFEQWVYRRGGPASYVYLQGGVVVSYEVTR